MIIKEINLNKNRGWRGLAELKCYGEDHKQISHMIFSFSEKMWKDMLKGYIVTQDKDHYHIIKFDNTEPGLPRPHQQRSVLIKNYTAKVEETYSIAKEIWTEAPSESLYNILSNFIKNKNNHTTSDWNCIGIRVIPRI